MGAKVRRFEGSVMQGEKNELERHFPWGCGNLMQWKLPRLCKGDPSKLGYVTSTCLCF